jgi:hypothetical protein
MSNVIVLPAVADAIAALLAADEVDEEKIAALATRDHFPDAAELLQQAIKPKISGLIGLLFAPSLLQNARLLRVAACLLPEFRIDSNGRYLQHIKNPDAKMQSLARGKTAQAMQARTALAILGEPCAPYSKLSRPERAGVLLRLLVDIWRERVP